MARKLRSKSSLLIFPMIFFKGGREVADKSSGSGWETRMLRWQRAGRELRAAGGGMLGM